MSGGREWVSAAGSEAGSHGRSPRVPVPPSVVTHSLAVVSNAIGCSPSSNRGGPSHHRLAYHIRIIDRRGHFSARELLKAAGFIYSLPPAALLIPIPHDTHEPGWHHRHRHRQPPSHHSLVSRWPMTPFQTAFPWVVMAINTETSLRRPDRRTGGGCASERCFFSTIYTHDVLLSAALGDCGDGGDAAPGNRWCSDAAIQRSVVGDNGEVVSGDRR